MSYPFIEHFLLYLRTCSLVDYGLSGLNQVSLYEEYSGIFGEIGMQWRFMTVISVLQFG